MPHPYQRMTPAKDSTGKPASRPKKAVKAVRNTAVSVSAVNESADDTEDQDLPSDAAGRLKIKRQYEELLGIRIEKLKGRILNREKINKTIEGIYFICLQCKRICHNLDEGLVQDPETHTCYCEGCRKKK